MKKRAGVLLVVMGVLLAALSGLVVLEIARQAARTSSAEAAEVQAQALNRVYVVIAARDLSENVALTEEDLGTKEFPAEFAPTDAVSAPELAVGKFTTSRVYKGQIIVAPLLSPVRMSGAIAARVPDGKVAMAVDVNDAMNSLDTLRPGDRVDVLLTLDLTNGMPASQQAGSPAAPSLFTDASLAAEHAGHYPECGDTVGGCARHPDGGPGCQRAEGEAAVQDSGLPAGSSGRRDAQVCQGFGRYHGPIGEITRGQLPGQDRWSDL